MKRRWYRQLVRRRVIVILLILLQLYILGSLVLSTSRVADWISYALSAVSVFVALYTVTRTGNPSYRLTWVFLILLFPVFGGLFYLIFTAQKSTKDARKRQEVIQKISSEYLKGYGEATKEAIARYPEQAPQLKYMEKWGAFPAYKNTETEYFTLGEDMFEAMKREMKKAQKYIFMEFFIVEQGRMLDETLEILRERVAAGVEVRFMYDDMGCFLRLPRDFDKTLMKMGIKCRVFNRFRPFLSTIQNNRDHRKIVIIDGMTAFTGGINLADEYINEIVRFGHWKDTGLMMRGDAAWGFTVMYMQLWCTSARKLELEDYQALKPEALPKVKSWGYVQPYTDSPIDDEPVGEQVYLQMIHGAKNYLYITTPYLIMGDNLLSSLTLAAKSGVDVRIITPGVADKKLVHITTRSYYRDLIKDGVRIYEYTSGFMHSKSFVSDDKAAVVGTVNLDFRSLYLHFECGAFMIGTDAVFGVKDDFLKTLPKCREYVLDDFSNNIFRGLFNAVLRLFGPLM